VRDPLCRSTPIITTATTCPFLTFTPDGNRGGHALLQIGHRRTSYEPRHGKARQAGTSFESQTTNPVGSGYESQPCRTPER